MFVSKFVFKIIIVGSSCFFFLVGSGVAGEVLRGPYLQNGTMTEMTIRWRTENKSKSVVKYGNKANSLTKESKVKGMKKEHEVRIVGLESNTRYYYSIGDGKTVLAGGDKNHFFKTLPKVGSKQAIRFWVLGDSGSKGKNGDDVRDAYLELAQKEKPADFFLMLGDNAYKNGSDSEFQRGVFDRYNDILINKVFWSCIGNHDARDYDPKTGEFRKKYGPNMGHFYYKIHTFPAKGEAGGLASGTEAYYSFDYGNIHFVCLDSTRSKGFGTSLESTGPMVQWLKEDLAATNQAWVICFFHHPPHSRGTHNGHKGMRLKISPLLEAGGVDLVLSGHSHGYERSYLLKGIKGKLKGGDKVPASSIVDGGDGRKKGDGVYVKPAGKSVNKGTVYVVAGSSSYVGKSPMDHPAMVYCADELGSLIIDVADRRLEYRFLREKTKPFQVDDYFTIIKK